MSNRPEREDQDLYDPSIGDNVVDDSYAHETNPAVRYQVPVQKDEDEYDDPMQPGYADTWDQLDWDEEEAINESAVLGGDSLRHAKPQTANKYNEGPSEDDLPIKYD
ncbi:hypothetical protein ASPWEDRAFT_33356 [Aspergillus wentii DTO 134E9]|uniref:Uncharacterized protein n=1 Tax=Aspergillus wentii DTO 134E9 TaxID=1073089 RepID=A0A1L9RYJ1_ASPWE|nr:uncharacterized protein ASPWEDRAFT_33356 [Aspergillus wentii DTO 134E9]KAI9932444.1 hypothetical protein MW887_008685 [Aspergillus wentii]OJJ40011.1 hypothetical protein ASPWEDRAFT_33356 [Aspergillus wentii DTO 134E9]